MINLFSELSGLRLKELSEGLLTNKKANILFINCCPFESGEQEVELAGGNNKVVTMPHN